MLSAGKLKQSTYRAQQQIKFVLIINESELNVYIDLVRKQMIFYELPRDKFLYDSCMHISPIEGRQ